MANAQWKKLVAGVLAAALLAIACFAIACAPASSSSAGGKGDSAGSGTSAPLSASGSGESSSASGSSSASAEPSANSGGAFAGSGSSESSDELGNVVKSEDGSQYRDGEVLVELPKGVSASDLSDRLSELDFVATKSVSDEDVALGWVTLELQPGQDVAEAVTLLEESGVVASAQPNYVYHILESAPPAERASGHVDAQGTVDPLAAGAFQAIGTNDEYIGQSAWHLDAVGAYDAWQTVKANHRVTVAVIDSGCDTSHPDLKANIRDTYNVLDGSKNVSDSEGHGTHVAGIIAAVPNNGIGVAGVSYNAWILPVKVMNGETTDTSTLVKAYRYIIDNAKRYNIRVVNMSLGGEQEGLGTSDTATLRSIDEAYHAGILSIFAAGNDDAKIPYYCFPCDFTENGVGVINADSSTRKTGKPDLDSNYNKPGEKTKDLCAPGDAIVSTKPNGKYMAMSGTSMATPVVAGIAALVFTQNSALDAGEAKSVLCSTAEDLVCKTASGTKNVGFDDYTGYGMVRADDAVKGASASYITGSDSVVVGATTKLSVPQAGTWKWTSQDQSIATVNASTGAVTGVSHGEAVICATKGSTKLYRTVVVYEVALRGPSSIKVGNSTQLSAWANPVAAWTYSSSNEKVAKVGETSGVVVGMNAGTARITATLSANPNIKVWKSVKVVKRANPMSVAAKTKKVKYSALKRHSKTVKGCFSFKVKAKGKVTYAKVSKGSSKRLTINKKTGKITVKKGTKKGLYKIKVKVKAAGNAMYKAATKTVTVKVRVK